MDAIYAFLFRLSVWHLWLTMGRIPRTPSAPAPVPVAPPVEYVPKAKPPAEDIEAKARRFGGLHDLGSTLKDAEADPVLRPEDKAPVPPGSDRNERIYRALREQLPDVSNARISLWPERTDEAMVLEISVVRGWRVETITADEWERLRAAGAPLLRYADKARLCVSLHSSERARA